MGYHYDNRNIARNTIFLYIRMALVLFVGLFTSRVVLNTLGIDNYGIYNVVGGFVVLFGFLNGAMANASQRFITIELAHGNIERQIKTFSTALNIHILLAITITFLAETVGVYFFYHELIIPADRMAAAMWVYQISIATVILSIISVPYNAMIIAHERMAAFAWISIFDVCLKLVVVYLLVIAPFDKLIFYALLLFAIQVIDQLFYWSYCIKKFPDARYKYIVDKDMLKRMSNIAGWSLFGNLAGVGYTQGVNVLLNMFFGPVVNAARGIAVTVQGVMSGFSNNIQMAINPQITKSYAINDISRMHSLIFASSKFCFFLLLVFVMPVFMETKPILTAWLKNVPDDSIWFVRLILSLMLVDALANPLMVANQAVGKVKVYQSVVGGILLLIVPVAYFFLKLGYSAYSVFVVQLVMSVIATLFRIIIVGRMINMPILLYIQNVIIQIVSVFVTSLSLLLIIQSLLPANTYAILLMIVISIMVTLMLAFVMGFNKKEKTIVIDKAKTIINKVISIHSK